MTSDASQQRIEAALAGASDTRVLRLGKRAIDEVGHIFSACFGARPAVVVADPNTFSAAGRRVVDVLRATSVSVAEPLILDEPDLHAHFHHVEFLRRHIAAGDAIPVAVGSGTINDLTKLAAHLCERPYMVVATAASMDGYTAFGASITRDGSKQTFFCAAPAAVIADLDVICHAPAELNSAGYADLLAKVTAGADWIIADVLGCEAIDPRAWSLVQDNLRAWTRNPEGIRRGDEHAIAGLIEGLLMTGFAMQWCKSSRPASGSEHQFSHLWDMQDHRHNGRIPFHGWKVGIGTLASAALYEELLRRPLGELDASRTIAAWPTVEALREQVLRTHTRPDLRAVALQESEAKYVDRDDLSRRLERLRAAWPGLRDRLHRHLVASNEIRQMLREAGAPHEPEQIGIDLPRLRRSYIEAQQIRRRFTVLDLAAQTGLMSPCIDRLFGADGPWGGTRRP